MYFALVETKGRSLEEIDDIFIQSKGAFDTVRVAKEMPFHLDILATADATTDEKQVKKHVENV